MKTTKMSLANIQGKMSRTEMKKIMAGSGDDACALSFDCYKTVYNSTTHSFEEQKTGTISCSGSGDCTSTSYSISCPQASGNPDTAACAPGSHFL